MFCTDRYDTGNEKQKVVTVDREGWLERYWGGILSASASREDYLSRISTLLGKPENGALHVRIFGDPLFDLTLPEGLRPRVHLDVFTPPVDHLGWTGMQAFAVEVQDPASLVLTSFGSGGPGWTIDSPGVRMGYLPSVASPAQDVFTAYEETLNLGLARMQRMGFAPTELTRTWFHFRDVILEYHLFNRVRRAAFARCGIDLLPASTGIQGRISTGEPLVMGMLAYSGTKLRRKRVSNPVQCEADDYGSLFSRAIQIEGAGASQYLISGTAAIDTEGNTTNPQDPCGQLSDSIYRTGELLRACGLEWSDVAGGAVFLAPAYHAALRADFESTPLADLPLAWVVADICRQDLACEIEITAFGQPSHLGPSH